MVNLASLIESLSKEWQNPTRFMAGSVPSGIETLDRAIGPIRIFSGGIYGVLGAEGSRKTTFMLNILCNQMLSGKFPKDKTTLIDTLETGMTVQTYIEALISILATKILVHWHWGGNDEKDVVKLLKRGLPERDIRSLIEEVGYKDAGGHFRREVIKPTTLRGTLWTGRQKDAINLAKEIIKEWPIIIHGLSSNDDYPTIPTWDLDSTLNRWKFLTDKKNVIQIVVDNIQQYRLSSSGDTIDYIRMNQATNLMADWLRHSKGLIWAINQVPVSQKSHLIKLTQLPTGAGGAALKQQQHRGWVTYYDPRDNPYSMRVITDKSRDGHCGDLDISLDPHSGAFIGKEKFYSDYGH